MTERPRAVRLAVNLSDEALALLDRDPRAVDLVKLGPWAGADAIDRVRRTHGVLLHSLGVILSADRPVPPMGDDAARALLERSGTPWLSEHLGFAASDVTIRWNAGAVTVESAGPLPREEVAARLTRNLAALGRWAGRPVLGENLDYVDNPAYRYVTDPDLIRQVVEGADAGLLLDVAHARIAADWAGIPVRDYLVRLPLDRAVEWHVNGPRRRGDRLWDAHATLAEEDVELLAWLLPRCPALDTATLEYWGPGVDLELSKLSAVIGRPR